MPITVETSFLPPESTQTGLRAPRKSFPRTKPRMGGASRRTVELTRRAAIAGIPQSRTSHKCNAHFQCRAAQPIRVVGSGDGACPELVERIHFVLRAAVLHSPEGYNATPPRVTQKHWEPAERLPDHYHDRTLSGWQTTAFSTHQRVVMHPGERAS